MPTQHPSLPKRCQYREEMAPTLEWPHALQARAGEGPLRGPQGCQLQARLAPMIADAIRRLMPVQIQVSNRVRGQVPARREASH